MNEAKILLVIFFMLGSFFGANLIEIVQDILYLIKGKEKYFEWYKNSFIPPYITIPYHLLLMVFFLVIAVNILVRVK